MPSNNTNLCRGDTTWQLIWPRQAGTWGPLLQCCSAYTCTHLSSSKTNTEKLYGTKNNCVHAQLGQILDQEIKRRPKKPTATSEEPGTKTGCRSKSRVLRMPPALSTTNGWAEHLSHPSGPTPGHTPTLTPHKEPACPPSGSEQGNLLLVFAPSCGGRGPNKALPEFLIWPLVNFYWLWKAMNPGQYHDHC